MPKQILLLGCGDLGIRTAAVLGERGYHVAGARRSVSKLPSSIEPIALDVTDPAAFAKLDFSRWDAIIVSLTARGEDAYQRVYVGGVRNLLAALQGLEQPPAVLFVSSTSVYHQNDGSIVDEDSDTLPSGYSGKTMLAAEALLAESGLAQCSIRFSGIYGLSAVQAGTALRGSHLLEVLREGRIAPATPTRYSNRIHIDDCVGVLVFLLERYFTGQPLSPLYLASDGSPAPLHEIMHWLAEQAGIALDTLAEDYTPARGGNKRCVGKRLQEQGFRLSVADYRQGYLATAGDSR